MGSLGCQDLVLGFRLQGLGLGDLGLESRGSLFPTLGVGFKSQFTPVALRPLLAR